MTKRWQGPEHAYAEARWLLEHREELEYEIWKENNPKCENCGEREPIETMTEVCGDRWCTHCVDDDAFQCEACGGIFPDECLADVNLTLAEYVCTDCDEKCAAEKTRHHEPVEIPIGHLEYIVWVMANAAKDEPYEGTQPGNAKKWLKESIDLIIKSVPEVGVE